MHRTPITTHRGGATNVVRLGWALAVAAAPLVGCAVRTEDRAPLSRDEDSVAVNDPGVRKVSVAQPAPANETSCGGSAELPGDGTWTVAVGDVLRTFEVHVPIGYDATTPTPIVLNFHGLGSDGNAQDHLSGMSAKADASGFLAVHPNGLGEERSWNAGDCCGYAREANVDDLGFVRAMLDVLEARLCVDPRRVFATGMSNGALFAERLGCELAPRIAAIAPVAGVRVEPTCSPPRPVPVMEFHGTLDPVVPYEGDPEVRLLSAPDDFLQWASRDGCVAALAVTARRRDAWCDTFEDCNQNAAVTLCTIEGGGHTWPGGQPLPWFGYTTPYLSATDAMWTFFTAHPMSTTTSAGSEPPA